MKTTPESIVLAYRLQAARKEPLERPHIYSPKRPRIPWHQKIDWNVVSKMAAFCCAVGIALVMIYVIIRVIPFVEMLRWG